jgi:cold shock CspA family protein
MAQGTVKRFGSNKGYGFIAPGGGARDVSVHHSAIEADGYRIPRYTSASRRRFLAAGDGAGLD